MKKRLFIVLLSLLVHGVGCKNDELVSNRANAVIESGSGTVEGYVGYFSPSLPPPGSNISALPSGYAFASHHWVADSPKCSYSMIYLLGQDSLLKTALYVKAIGTWQRTTQNQGTTEYAYLKLVVDNLDIIQKK